MKIHTLNLTMATINQITLLLEHNLKSLKSLRKRIITIRNNWYTPQAARTQGSSLRNKGNSIGRCCMKISLICRVPFRKMDFKKQLNLVVVAQGLTFNNYRCANLTLHQYRRKCNKHKAQYILVKGREQSSHFASLKRTLQGKIGLHQLSLTQKSPLFSRRLNLIFIRVSNQTP
jgi:hypothetical protein